MPSAMEWFFGGGDKFKKLNNYNQGQTNNLNQLTDLTQQGGEGVSQVLNYLRQFMDPNSEEYKNFEAPYRQEFEQETVPMLAEEYAGKGALSSSGFGQALGSAGAGLQTKLAALKSGLKQQAGTSLLNQYNTSSQNALNARPFDYQKQEGNAGLIPSAISSGISGYTGGGGFDALIKQLMSKITGGGISGGRGNVGGNVRSNQGVGAF